MKKYLCLAILLTLSLNADWIDKTKDVLSSTKESLFDNNEIQVEMKIKKQRFDEIWAEVFPKLKEASLLEKNMINAPDSSLFKTDKIDIKADIDNLINNIYYTLLGDNLFRYKKNIDYYESKIAELKNEIQISHEKKLLAPIESTLSTTKNDFNEKIENLKHKIIFMEEKIIQIKSDLSQSFKEIGIKINNDQLDTILTRVDGNDFVQMYLITDILKEITKQLSELMNINNEELSIAKNYYGMHLVSMQLVVFVQEKYKDKLFNNYLAKLETMKQKNMEIFYETKYAIKEENNILRKEQYKNNLKAQEFNLKVIDLYTKHLNISLESVDKAIIESKKQVLLSKNTFLTVSSSTELFNLINQSIFEYHKVMQIQMPEIQVFKNMAIKQKYIELSKIIEN